MMLRVLTTLHIMGKLFFNLFEIIWDIDLFFESHP